MNPPRHRELFEDLCKELDHRDNRSSSACRPTACPAVQSVPGFRCVSTAFLGLKTSMTTKALGPFYEEPHMNAFPTQCDACQAVLRTSDDSRTLDCPVCGPRFHLRTPCPYNPEVIEEANRQIDLIEKAIPSDKPEVRHALLWLLEERWLFTIGHQITIKVGSPLGRGPTKCDICGKVLENRKEVSRVEVRDRWRKSATMLDVCRDHLDEHMWEGDVDVLRNQSLKLGLA